MRGGSEGLCLPDTVVHERAVVVVAQDAMPAVCTGTANGQLSRRTGSVALTTPSPPPTTPSTSPNNPPIVQNPRCYSHQPGPKKPFSEWVGETSFGTGPSSSRRPEQPPGRTSSGRGEAAARCVVRLARCTPRYNPNRAMLWDGGYGETVPVQWCAFGGLQILHVVHLYGFNRYCSNADIPSHVLLKHLLK